MDSNPAVAEMTEAVEQFAGGPRGGGRVFAARQPDNLGDWMQEAAVLSAL